MLQKIIDRLEKECEENINDNVKRVICNHVADKLQSVPEDILKKLADDDELTLEGAIDRMMDEARKKCTGNYGGLSDEEGYAIVDAYFGINCEAAEDSGETVSLFDLI